MYPTKMVVALTYLGMEFETECDVSTCFNLPVLMQQCPLSVHQPKNQKDFGSGWVGWVKCPIGN